MPIDQHFINHLVDYMYRATKNYPFKEEKEEPPNASEDELRKYRLKVLIKAVILMGKKKYYQHFKNHTKEFTEEDWIHYALKIWLEKHSEYDPKKTQYNCFIRYIVNKRLIDLLRKKIKKSHVQMDRTAHNIDPSIQETIMIKSNFEQSKRNDLDLSVEERRLFWACINKLSDGHKLLLVLHEFEEVSFKSLCESEEYCKILGRNRTVSRNTFIEDYNQQVFNPVSDCIQYYMKLNKIVKEAQDESA